MMHVYILGKNYNTDGGKNQRGKEWKLHMKILQSILMIEIYFCVWTKKDSSLESSFRNHNIMWEGWLSILLHFISRKIKAIELAIFKSRIACKFILERQYILIEVQEMYCTFNSFWTSFHINGTYNTEFLPYVLY